MLTIISSEPNHVRDEVIVLLCPKHMGKTQSVEHRKGCEQPARMSATTFEALHTLIQPPGALALAGLGNYTAPTTAQHQEIEQLMEQSPYEHVTGKGAVIKSPQTLRAKSKHDKERRDLTRRPFAALNEQLATAPVEVPVEDEAAFLARQVAVKKQHRASVRTLLAKGCPHAVATQHMHGVDEPQMMSALTHIALQRLHQKLCSVPADKRNHDHLDAIGELQKASPWMILDGVGCVAKTEQHTAAA